MNTMIRYLLEINLLDFLFQNIKRTILLATCDCMNLRETFGQAASRKISLKQFLFNMMSSQNDLYVVS